jgi:exodeoxyribonuclease VII small subunit
VTEINFEQAILKLENEVKKLESGNMSLDDSIASYEEAVRLVRICNQKLENAERRVRLLTEGKDGVVTDLPFDTDNEA